MTKNEINLKKQTFPSFLVLRYEIPDMNNILPFFTSSFLLLLDMYLIYNLFFKAGLNLSDIHVTHFPNASPTRLRKTMYRGELVWCTAYCQTFFPGPLFPFFSTKQEGNLFPGKKSWLAMGLLPPLGPFSSSESGASWTEETPLNLRDRKGTKAKEDKRSR